MSRQSWSAWTVSAPVERPVKQRNASTVNATDLYVDIACPYCKETFEATHASVSKNKSHVCKAHLVNKKCNIPLVDRDSDNSSALALPASKSSRMTVVKHRACNRRISDLERDQDLTNARLDVLEAKSTLYDGALKAVMPLVELPLVHGRAEQQLRIALPMTPASTSIVPISALVSQSAIEGSVGCDRLCAENATLKRKYEVSERDRAAAIEQNKRLRNGDEIDTLKTAINRHGVRENAYERALISLNKVLHEKALPHLTDEQRLQATESFKHVMRVMKSNLRSD